MVNRPRCLIQIKRHSEQSPVRQVNRTDSQPPSLYVFNAAALSKPHAVEALQAELIGYNADIALISETHFKTRHTNESMGIAGYTLYRRDREGRRGGGVAAYVSNQLQSSEWSCTTAYDRRIETMWIHVTGPGKHSFICVLYHPPRPIYQTYELLKHIELSTEEISTKYPNAFIVVAGDMNSLPDQEIIDATV